MPQAARLALYSHDAQGLGHLRRNLNIANHLISSGLDLTVLMICGSRNIAHFQLESGIDALILPALRKHKDGHYQPRHLGIDHSQLLTLRQQTILSAIDAFNPDILIVDKLPLGFAGELRPTLELMRTRPGLCILGLRDIIDNPQIALEEWDKAGGDEAVNELYDRIWVYGDQTVYDLTADYNFCSQTLEKTTFTGYLNPLQPQGGVRVARDRKKPAKSAKETFLCLVGGGQDGYELSRLFLKTKPSANQKGILVTGPFMSSDHRNKLRQKARRRGGFQVIDFMPSLLPLMRKADRIISLGGYNTICEILAHGIPTLVIPRVVPRQEQLIRARVFSERGLLDYLHPDEVNPEALRDWIRKEKHARFDATATIDFSGLATIQRHVQSILTARR